MMKRIFFVDSSLADLQRFPLQARREAGYQLHRVQHGEMPFDWKPMPDVGMGVRELRIKDTEGIYRILYIAKFKEAIYVLHCFQKKSQATNHHDLELAKKRYKSEVSRRKNDSEF
ncbi:type II toxin-antitoxin system RelE/ParE family toxin [Rahnella variigena]|jgi:phage-related protein|nr:type II toxin-antitoxin system RelE/ParE family toxin [Rahnella variigena]MDH2897624.1 type II toxin-antitoxin system RelE/ParE family toxin [Rahnella variigena]